MPLDIYENSFHSGHLYLHIEEREAKDIRVPLFEELMNKYNKPLQIIVPSDSDQLIRLLSEAGFLLKRRCYEVHAGASDLILPLPDRLPPIADTRKGLRDYTPCADLMYLYYCETHAAVNPLTAPKSGFYEMLPDAAVYAASGGRITAAAFIEENEIAYVCGNDPGAFPGFARSLLSCMFKKHGRIFFEADDTDWAATQLRAMFSVAEVVHYDTYVKSR